MKGFDFKLAALLKHRQQVEKEKQRRVAQIQQEMQLIQRHIQETQSRIATENGALGTRELTGRLDMQYIAHEKRYVGNLAVRIALAHQKLASLEPVLAKARDELLTAARARKVLEKLREKQFNRWRKDLEMKEAAIIDEIGTQWAVRSAMEDGDAGTLATQGAAR